MKTALEDRCQSGIFCAFLLLFVKATELYRKWYLEGSFKHFLFKCPAMHSLTCVKEAINFHIYASSAFITFITNNYTFWTRWCLYPYALMFYYFWSVLPICFRGEFPSLFCQSCFCLLFLRMPVNNEVYACASPPYGTMWFFSSSHFLWRVGHLLLLSSMDCRSPANGHITQTVSKVDSLFCKHIIGKSLRSKLIYFVSRWIYNSNRLGLCVQLP